MKPVLIVVPLALALSGCATPRTVLVHDKTGQIAICGGSATGSLVGGVVGYQMEKASAAECVSDHIEAGYRRKQDSL